MIDLITLPYAVLIAPILWTWMRPAEQAVLLAWLRHFWPVVRPILGVLFLIIGVLGIILPILQGIIFLVLGAALIGPRHPKIRWARVQYRLLLRRLDYSPNRFLSWIGGYGRKAFQEIRTSIRDFKQRFAAKRYKKRRFRIVVVPDSAIAEELDQWRMHFDPSWRYGLPPHIVLVSSSRSQQRDVLEQKIRELCADLNPFDVSLITPVTLTKDCRIACPVEQGAEQLTLLRIALCDLIKSIDPAVRVSQRTLWPALTVVKIKNIPKLIDIGTLLAEQPFYAKWSVESLEVYEERFGHVWYRVQSIPFRSLFS